MKFSPPDFTRVAFVLALVALPLVPGVATGGPSAPPGKQAPSNTSPPTVSGVAQAGSSLTAEPGTWSAPGIKFSFQWERCGVDGGGCSPVAGAAGKSYGLTAADVASRVRVVVTASNKNGETSAASEPTGVVAVAPAPASAVAPSNTSASSVSGVAKAGETLRTDRGSWSGTEPISYGYQWQRCDSSGAGCSAVSSATDETYLLGSADVGKTMRVVVTASNAAGSATATSAATALVGSGSVSSSGSGCSASNPSACPASWFTGPLGSGNLVPSKPGAFLIEWFEGSGCDTACKKAGVQKRQADSGRVMDGIGLHPYYAGSDCSSRMAEETSYVSWMNSNGSFPVLSWTPDYTIGQVNSGAADACFRTVASFLKSFSFRIMLRPFWEFDGDWFIWSALPGSRNGNVNYCGQPFVDAWRRMVKIFKEQGASNVGFFWNPGEGGLDRSCSVKSYPGDAYVDWVGAEAYNFFYVEESGWGTPLHSGWAEFWELANYTGQGGYCSSEPVNAPTCVSQYDKFSGGVYARKPFVTGETGTTYDPKYPLKKGEWFRNLVRALKGELGPKAMPGVVGIQFFDADVTAAEGPRANYRVDHPTSDPSAYNGWIALARDPYFNTR